MCAGRSGKTGLLHKIKRRLFTAKNFKGGKPMKKFLSLVLALVMTMSLVTISAGATDFTDSDSIQYKEAVDVISAIGIVDGDTNGSFRPTDTLTRQAAAKIICNLILGPTTASALVADSAPYPDVPVTSSFAGYIAYCQKTGIISGYANGSFNPTGTLTGQAFMKMLLGALGYRSDVEGYTGSNWSVAVVKRALGIGLDDGLTSEFVGTKSVTREEAALYACNMLQADLVEYENNNTVVVNGTTISNGVTTAQAVQANNSTAAKNARNIGSGTKNNYIQFAEMYFSNLELRDTEQDDFGRPANVWYYKGVKIGTYADTADASYTSNVKLNAIYSDLGMAAKATDTTIYMNGVLAYATDTWTETVSGVDVNYGGGTHNVQQSDDTKLGSIAIQNITSNAISQSEVNSDGDTVLKVGDGTITEVFLDKDTNAVTICIMSVYGGKITAVKDATSKKDAYVVVDCGSNNDAANTPASFTNDDNNQYETTDFAEDDVVAFTYSEKNGDYAIKTMTKLESVEGSLTKRIIDKSVQLGDTTYKYAKNYTFDDSIANGRQTGLTNGSEYVIYLDAQGNALWIEESSFAVSSYALVLAIEGQAANSTFNSNRAKLLFSDGTKKTVDLDKDYEYRTDEITGAYSNTAVAEADSVRPNTIVRFKVESSGEYKLTNVDFTASGTGDVNIQNKTVTFNGNNVACDSNTIFVVQKNNSDSFSVYTGIKNAPTVILASNTQAEGYVYSKSGVAKVVFVTNCTSTNSSKDVTFIAGKSRSNIQTENDTADFYQYNAVVNGEITTIMVNATQVASATNILESGSKNNVIVNNTTSDNDDIISSAYFNNNGGTITTGFAAGDKTLRTDGSGTYGTGVKKINNSTAEIKLDGATLALANDVKVYTIDNDGDITATTLAELKSNSSADAYYTMEDGEITNLFVQLPKE
jgi:hypothetical protein